MRLRMGRGEGNRRRVGMEQECLGAVGKGDCKKQESYQRGVEGSGIQKGKRRQGWGRGIRRINGAGQVLGKRGI